MRIPITSVPQADELFKVISTVEAVKNGFVTDQQIADYVGFTDRQGRYYRLAAIILGLLDNNNNTATLTELGDDLIVLDSENRERKIRTILREQTLFKEVLQFIETRDDGVSRAELLEYLLTSVDGSESTIIRRYSTVISWLSSSMLLKLDKREITANESETVYKINDQLEEEDFMQESDFHDSIYPATYTNEELDIKETHMQVISFQRKKEQGKILVPEFQRHQVWKQQQKSRFIESLILNIPVPPFYISQDLEGGMIIIDGLQRSTAIFEFLANSYSLVGLEALPQLNGKSFQDLEDLKARIEDRELLHYVLKPSVPMSIVYDIFNRINSNGTPLTRQEIRNCIYIGKATRLLAFLAESTEFKIAIDRGIQSLRMKDREAILRFFAFSTTTAIDDYKSDMDDFLGKAMKSINRMSDSEINTLIERFKRVMVLSFDFFGLNNFRLPIGISRGRINIALMESILVYFDKTSDNDLIFFKEIIISNYYNKLLKDIEFRESIRNSTNSERNVKIRFKKVFELLNSTQ